MTVDASADIQKFIYDKYNLSGISADAKLKNGLLNATVNSRNKLLNGKVSVDGLVGKRKLTPLSLPT